MTPQPPLADMPAVQSPNAEPALVRCRWANPASPLYLAYHDTEWGVPCTDERRLFEMLNLEGAQAGLSWSTILNKRAHYACVFDNWDAQRIAQYDATRVAALLADPGIVRNRLKVAATITNARAYLALCESHGGLVPFLWAYVGGTPMHSAWHSGAVPARTDLSDQVSQDLAALGFRFVGSTIIYAYLQAIGIVNDHCTDCFLHAAPECVGQCSVV